MRASTHSLVIRKGQMCDHYFSLEDYSGGQLTIDTCSGTVYEILGRMGTHSMSNTPSMKFLVLFQIVCWYLEHLGWTSKAGIEATDWRYGVEDFYHKDNVEQLEMFKDDFFIKILADIAKKDYDVELVFDNTLDFSYPFYPRLCDDINGPTDLLREIAEYYCSGVDVSCFDENWPEPEKLGSEFWTNAFRSFMQDTDIFFESSTIEE